MKYVYVEGLIDEKTPGMKCIAPPCKINIVFCRYDIASPYVNRPAIDNVQMHLVFH